MTDKGLTHYIRTVGLSEEETTDEVFMEGLRKISQQWLTEDHIPTDVEGTFSEELVFDIECNLYDFVVYWKPGK